MKDQASAEQAPCYWCKFGPLLAMGAAVLFITFILVATLTAARGGGCCGGSTNAAVAPTASALPPAPSLPSAPPFLLLWTILVVAAGVIAGLAVVLLLLLILFLIVLWTSSGQPIMQVLARLTTLLSVLLRLPDLATAVRLAAASLKTAGDAATLSSGFVRTASQVVGDAATQLNNLELPTARWSLERVVKPPPGLPTVYYVKVSNANTKVFSGVGEQLSQQGSQLGTAADRLSDLGKDLGKAASNLNKVAGLLPGGGP